MRSVSLAFLLAFAVPAVADEPSAADFKARLDRLTPTASKEDRLAVAKWLRSNTRSSHAGQAVPALEKLVRQDPDAEVREQAVIALGQTARALKKPCPLALVEAIRDKEDLVRWNAGVLVALFKKDVEPGSLAVLIEGAEKDRAEVREHCVIHLGIAGGKDPKALAAIEKAKADPNSMVRHTAHCAKFTATDDLGEFLAYLVRLREDPEWFKDKHPAGSEEEQTERTRYNLVQLGAATRLAEWAEQRPDEMATQLMKLLDDKSAMMRRGAAHVVGASARKVDIKPPFDPLKPFEERPSYLEPLLPLLDPDTPPKEPKKEDPPEPSRAAVRLRALKVEVRLTELREKDADETVREAAGAALKRLAEVPPKTK